MAEIQTKNNKSEEYIKNYWKSYYQNNKTELQQKATERIECEHCGKMIQRQHIRKHHNTKKCQYVRMKKAQDELITEKQSEKIVKVIQTLIDKTIAYTNAIKEIEKEEV